jgi:CTP synthase
VLDHSAHALNVPIEVAWLPTPGLETGDIAAMLEPFDALWGSPGSPYDSMAGAFRAIRYAREHDRPYLGT